MSKLPGHCFILIFVINHYYLKSILCQNVKITKSLFQPESFAVRSIRVPRRSRLPRRRRPGRAGPTRRCRRSKWQTRTSTSWIIKMTSLKLLIKFKTVFFIFCSGLYDIILFSGLNYNQYLCQNSNFNNHFSIRESGLELTTFGTRQNMY